MLYSGELPSQQLSGIKIIHGESKNIQVTGFRDPYIAPWLEIDDPREVFETQE